MLELSNYYIQKVENINLLFLKNSNLMIIKQ